MPEFDFEYTKMLEKIYIQEQLHSQMGVYYPMLNKIYVNQSKLNSIQKLIVFAHEFVHFQLMNGNLGIIIQDLDWICNYLSWLFEIVSNNELNSFLLSKGIIDRKKQIDYILNNDIIGLVYLNCEALVLIAKLCTRIDKRIQLLIDKSLLVQEGLATFMSLNMSTNNVYKDLLFAVSRNFKESMLPELKYEQKKQKEYIQRMSNNPYSDGYLFAEKIEKEFGEDRVFFSGFLAHDVPLCEFDLIGMSDTEFDILLNGVLNCSRRWNTIAESFNSLFDDKYGKKNMKKLMESLRYGVDVFKKGNYMIPAQYTIEEMFGHRLINQIEQLITIESDFKAIIALARKISPHDYNTFIGEHESFTEYIQTTDNNRKDIIENYFDIQDPLFEYGKEAEKKDLIILSNKAKRYNQYKQINRRVKDDKRI